jgi:hypothetical protein
MMTQRQTERLVTLVDERLERIDALACALIDGRDVYENAARIRAIIEASREMLPLFNEERLP